MKSKRIIIVSLSLLGLAGLGMWWAFADAGPDPEVEKIKETMKTAFESRESMTPAQRQQSRQQIHQQIESLSEEQRHEVFAGMRQQFQVQMEKRFDEYFNAPPEQRLAVLDKQIMEMEKFRREMEQRRQARGQNGDRGGPGSTQRGGQGGPLGGPRGSRTPEQRQERMKSRLDNSDPVMRAKGAEYFSAMKKRREQLGLPPMHRHH